MIACLAGMLPATPITRDTPCCRCKSRVSLKYGVCWTLTVKHGVKLCHCTFGDIFMLVSCLLASGDLMLIV